MQVRLNLSQWEPPSGLFRRLFTRRAPRESFDQVYFIISIPFESVYLRYSRSWRFLMPKCLPWVLNRHTRSLAVWSLVEAFAAPERHENHIDFKYDQYLRQKRTWCVIAFGFVLYLSVYVRSLLSNCHSPRFSPGSPLPPKAPARTVRMPNRVLLTPFLRHAERARRYRLLGRCLLSFWPQRALLRFLSSLQIGLCRGGQSPATALAILSNASMSYYLEVIVLGA